MEKNEFLKKYNNNDHSKTREEITKDKNGIKDANNQHKIINVDNIDSSTFKTKRKAFISEINPHLVRRTIQKEQYIWFGVYDDLLRKKCILKALKKCRDTSLPLVIKKTFLLFKLLK